MCNPAKCRYARRYEGRRTSVRLPRHHAGCPRAKLGMSCRLARRGCQAGSDLIWPRQCIGHHVGDARDVQNVTRALGDEGKLTLLARSPWLRHPVESRQKRLVVGPQLKVAALQHETEVPNGAWRAASPGSWGCL